MATARIVILECERVRRTGSLPYHLGMKGFPGWFVVWVVALATICAGCGGGKKTVDPAPTVASTRPVTTTSSTTRLQSVRATCSELRVQDRSLRVQEKAAVQKLAATRKSNPKSPDISTLDTQRLEIQRTLRAVDDLLADMRARNGASACPSR
jgi:hypothetical protein